MKYIRLAGAAIITMTLGILYAWSIFRAPLSAMFDTWTSVNLSWIFTISMLGFLVGGLISGRLVKTMKHRYVLLIAAASTLIGFLNLSRIDSTDPEKSLIFMLVFYGVFCGIGLGMPYYAILGAMLEWFPGKEGFASGVLMMGLGFGGLITGNIIDTLITSFGLNQTFIVLAICVTPIIGIGYFFISTPSTSIKSNSAKTEVLPVTNAPILGELTAGHMVKTSAFLILFLHIISITMGGLMIMNSAASISLYFGYTASLGLIATIFSGIARFAFGLFTDHFGGRKSMLLSAFCLIASGIVMVTGILSGNYALVIIGLPLAGLAHGSSPVITSVYVNHCFGSKNYTHNLSIVSLAVMVSSVIGPVLSGTLQDNSGGSYNGTFILVGIMGIVALLLSLKVRKDI